MILIGTVNLTRTRNQGNFNCPTCAVSQAYRMRACRPWLTLYFIPTIPVGGYEYFVQCEHCKSIWDPTVLEMDQLSRQTVREEQFRDEAVRSAVLVVLADNQITEKEILTLQRIATRLLQRPVGREELGQICSSTQQKRVQAVNYVLTISKHWNQEQRRQALQAMFLAATADGQLGDLQLNVLAKMQELFEFTDSEYQAAIEEALGWDPV